MAFAFDEYQLENIARDHRIGAGIFVPFAIARLRGDADATEAILTVKLRDMGNAGETLRRLRLSWSDDSAQTKPPAVQEKTITEWAACGVACAVVAVYSELRVCDVAASGDRFDYWLDGGEYEYGLEVSGTLTGDLETRHREKVRQLQDNPYGVDGYVIVVKFDAREIIFSFNRFQEEVI